jgi:RimJ/RimL family protein N-acetyltransferase
MLVTRRLELHEVQLSHRLAFRRGRKELARVLGTTLPEGWPEFPEAFAPPPAGADLVGESATDLWPGYLFVDRQRGALIGNGGFAGEPDAAGDIEIGYEVAPVFRNKGYASEAVRALVEHAFTHSAIRGVIAHTLATEDASARVLRNVGFHADGEVASDELGAVWRWRLRRDDWPRR